LSAVARTPRTADEGFSTPRRRFSTPTDQLVKRYNCHEPGCWRVGTHPAAGGQFSLCYRHHPDFEGKQPTHEMIARLHREHEERQAAIHTKLAAIDQRVSP
jgi:hypothetical protein